MDSLVGMKSFVRVAEALSFVSAGRSLGISPSAVGKNVAKLEQELGVQLLYRTTRRIALSEEGQVFYEHCKPILDGIANAVATMEQLSEAPNGILRVSMQHICYRFLMPALPEFRKAYPEIELHLDFDDRPLELVDREFDAIIRSGELEDSALKSRKLGDFKFIMCASKEYLTERGTPAHPQHLSSHHAIQFRYPTTGKLKEWTIARSSVPKMKTALVCNNMEAVRGALLGGLGIAFVPDFLVADALEQGQIATILDRYQTEPYKFTILWPSSRHVTPRLQAFIKFAGSHLFPRNAGAR